MNKPTLRWSLMRRSRLSLLFVILIVGVIGGVGNYWFFELEPRLNREAQSHAQILATAMADSLSVRIPVAGKNKSHALIRRDLERMLLLTDPNTGVPFILQVSIEWDTDLLSNSGNQAILNIGVDCLSCFKAEVPIFHPRSHELLGIAHFQISAVFHNQIREQLQKRILGVGAAALLLIFFVWWAVDSLSSSLNDYAKQLVDANESLEEKVQERTAELEKTHRRLIEETEQRHHLEQAGQRLRHELEDQERARLAAMLHDGPGQTAQALLLGLKMFRKQWQTIVYDKKDGDLDILISDANVAISEIRGLTRDLRPFSLEGITLAEAIRQQSARMSRLSGIYVNIDIENDPIILKRQTIENLYLMFQEILNNSIKHAKASRIGVKLRYPNLTLLCLRVEDNGRGFDVSEQQSISGYGLSILKERICELDGKLTIDSAPNQGATIQLEVAIHDTNNPC
ncbi:MAG: hypothetical protein HQL68_08820 [Magnetococcales bacterium]|nr:hypothetical protein [Magnetococcales bacterium]